MAKKRTDGGTANLFGEEVLDPGSRPGKPKQLLIDGGHEEARTLRNGLTEAQDRAREAGKPVPIAYTPQKGQVGYHQREGK